MLDARGLIRLAKRGEDAGSLFYQTLAQEISESRYQLQFSIHTTDIKQREEVIPEAKWSFGEIAGYGDRFFEEGAES